MSIIKNLQVGSYYGIQSIKTYQIYRIIKINKDIVHSIALDDLKSMQAQIKKLALCDLQIVSQLDGDEIFLYRIKELTMLIQDEIYHHNNAGQTIPSVMQERLTHINTLKKIIINH